MPSAKPFGQLRAEVEARPGAVERLAALREQTLAEIGLDTLRRATGATQTDVAASLGVTQSAISQLEHSEDLRISTLRQYLAGLGAHLHLTAVFDGGGEQVVVPIVIGPSPSATRRPGLRHVPGRSAT